MTSDHQSLLLRFLFCWNTVVQDDDFGELKVVTLGMLQARL